MMNGVRERSSMYEDSYEGMFEEAAHDARKARSERDQLRERVEHLETEVTRLKIKANRWRDVANKVGLILTHVTQATGPDYHEALSLTFDDGPEIIDEVE